MKKIIATILSLAVFTQPVMAEINVSLPSSNGITIVETTENPEASIEALKNGETVALSDITYDSGVSLFSDTVITSTKYYDQLTMGEKCIYDGALGNANNFLSGNTSVSISCNEEVGVGLTTDEAWSTLTGGIGTNVAKALLSVQYDNPENFWFDINKIGIGVRLNSYDSTAGVINYTVTLGVGKNAETNVGYTDYWPAGYTSRTQVVNDRATVEDTATEILDSLPTGATDFEKVRLFNDWLCDNNTYNPYIGGSKTGTVLHYPYIITSAMIYGQQSDDTKYPVCQGYAYALKYLCNRAGIDSMVVTSAGHMWNLISLDNKWYVIDSTWNDNLKDNNLAANIKDTAFTKYQWQAVGSESVTTNDQNNGHLKKLQFGLDAIDPTEKDFLTNCGVVSYRALDANSDTELNTADVSTFLKATNGVLRNTKDVNGDGKTDLLDATAFLKLMYK